ncbi:MAG: GNAT family N-acetyltransferase [Geminicoccaceae bacterium]
MIYMAAGFTIQPIDLGNGDAVKALVADASAEGFEFADRLVGEWKSGVNRFSKPGEKLLGVFDGEVLVAVGGLNRDPYAQKDHVGRLRHIYVHPRYRRLGIGRKLVAALLEDLDEHFEKVRLRTSTTAASRFYQACNFRSSDETDATHEWV